MTIQPKQDCFIVSCDTCPDYFVDETLEFKQLIKTIKFKGWKTYKGENNRQLIKCQVCEEG